MRLDESNRGEGLSQHSWMPNGGSQNTGLQRGIKKETKLQQEWEGDRENLRGRVCLLPVPSLVFRGFTCRNQLYHLGLPEGKEP